MSTKNKNAHSHPQRKHPTVGVCGLDCGLCPRYYTAGASKCPGCCGPDFFEKHPSCGVITCCVKKKGLEICSECAEFPCSRFRDTGKQDSFVTYRNVISTLSFIRDNGIEDYLARQKRRMDLLQIMLSNYDDGRSKNFYCMASALLSMDDLESALSRVNREARKGNDKDNKMQANALKTVLNQIASERQIEIALRKQPK